MSMSGLAPELVGTFCAVADTFLPRTAHTPGGHAASDLDLAEEFEHLVLAKLSPVARGDLERLLSLLSSRAGALALYGRPKPFRDLTAPEREAALRRMAASRLNQVRQGYRALKSLAGFLFTAPRDPGDGWPPWLAMGYPGPDGPPPDEPKRLLPVVVDRPTALTADVVVVGSGAGGGPAAAVLAAAGLDVVVVEKGGYHNEADFTHLESDAYQRLYLDHNLGSTPDGAVSILAGSTLGGGTVVNYTTSFATPEDVRAEWDREAGFDEVFTGPEYRSASDAVHARLGINRDHNEPSGREELIEKALRELGWHIDYMPRNVVGCEPDECGFCGLGCRRAAKQSTLRTWLEDAAGHGARFIVGADVHRILFHDGAATGVEAIANGHPVTVRARAVVLAAGALNTPAILLRSGVGGKAVGRFLRLHPVTVVWGRFPDPVEPWTGIMQAVHSDEFADLDGNGYGFRFETAAVHPAFPSTFIPWEDGRQFKDDLYALRHWAPVGILLRDYSAGRVKVRRDGRPVWTYGLDTRDAAHFREGVRRGFELMAAAGASEIVASTLRPVRMHPGGDRDGHQFESAWRDAGYGPNQTIYLSFHQMGSARMGSDPRTSVVDATNQVHGVPGLFVMDGSCFPTASGVNPMISIQSIAHRAASNLAASLT